MDNPWPADIPWSLWNYQGLTISDMPQLPMMGVRFEPSFLYAFAFGRNSFPVSSIMLL